MNIDFLLSTVQFSQFFIQQTFVVIKICIFCEKFDSFAQKGSNISSQIFPKWPVYPNTKDGKVNSWRKYNKYSTIKVVHCYDNFM